MSEFSNGKIGPASAKFPYRSLSGSQQSFFIAGTLLQEQQVSRMYQVAKRTLDICGALVGLIILVLVLCVVAPLILIEDQGSIIYKQVRVGHYGKPFLIYKLRSMIMGADGYLVQRPELLNAWRRTGKLQINEDPRITRIGRFLRKSSLDELPQMWNVLRGEMSLVGPRAIQFSEVTAFGELAVLRQMVKPGLTGLWQVCGRSLTDYEQRALLDCIYVLKRSFWVDLYILFRTLPVVLYGTGAC